MKGINWDKVDYEVKALEIKYMKAVEPLHKYSLLQYCKQPKAWQLYFILAYLLMIYTFIALTIPLLSINTFTWFLGLVVLLTTPLFFGDNFMAMFTKWVKIPVISYLFGLTLFVIGQLIS